MPVKYVDMSKIRSVLIDREKAKILIEVLDIGLGMCCNERKIDLIKSMTKELRSKL